MESRINGAHFDSDLPRMSRFLQFLDIFYLSGLGHTCDQPHYCHIPPNIPRAAVSAIREPKAR